MNRSSSLKGPLFAIAALASLPLCAATSAEPIDNSAAIRLARNEHCLRCHGIDKKKEGPSYALLAARYEGKPNAEDRLFKHVTSGEFVKLSDGHKENHKNLKGLDPAEVRNLVRWILAQGA
jgi:cytochrome c